MKNSISIISSPQKCQVSGVSESIVKKQLQPWWEPCFEIVRVKPFHNILFCTLNWLLPCEVVCDCVRKRFTAILSETLEGFFHSYWPFSFIHPQWAGFDLRRHSACFLIGFQTVQTITLKKYCTLCKKKEKCEGIKRLVHPKMKMLPSVTLTYK